MQKFQKVAFYWWMTQQDRSIRWGDKFLYSENIDINSDPKIIELTKDLTADISTSQKVKQMHAVTSTDLTKESRLLAMCEWGTVYQAWNSTAVYTNWSLGSLEYPCFTLWDRFYFVNSGGVSSAFKLNYVTLTDAVSTSWTPTLAHKNLATNDYYTKFAVAVVWSRAYIGLWRAISVYKSDTGKVTNYDWVQEEIVGMSYGGSTIKIITEVWKMHIWDGVSESPIETINLNMNIQNTYEIGGIIYLVTGFKWNERGLYYLNGYTPVRLYEKNLSSEASRWKFDFEDGLSMITNDKENLYFVNYDGSWGLGYYVALYGRCCSELPMAFSNTNVFINTWERPFSIDAIKYYNGDLYVAWTDDGSNWIDKIGTNKNTTWYIETTPEDYNTGIYRKGAKHLKFRVWDLDANHTIVVKESRDGGSYTTLWTFNSQPEDDIVRIPLNWDFREHRLRFEFTSNDTTSPKIYYWYEYAYEVKDI